MDAALDFLAGVFDSVRAFVAPAATPLFLLALAVLWTALTVGDHR